LQEYSRHGRTQEKHPHLSAERVANSTWFIL
jgi:hypothetical protein